MPIIASAEKKLRQDVKRHMYNVAVLKKMKGAVSAMRKTPSVKLLTEAFSELDTAAKKNVIHKNKAARLKSRLAKLVAPKKVAPPKASN